MFSATATNVNSQDWRSALDDGEIDNQNAYDHARNRLQAAEQALAFDAEAIASASDIEKEATKMVQKIRLYDREMTYAQSSPTSGSRDGNTPIGHHFLGNVDLINQTLLMKVARKMPKGAHLHIHFNSCLSASFLIRRARNVDAMYIRSTLPLTSEENMTAARISFMVLTLYDATHIKGADGTEKGVPLGNLWASDYVPNSWMRYKEFQQTFELVQSDGSVLQGTKGAEAWLERKMLFSEEEAHGVHQTERGIWEKFNYRTQMMKGLFAYESAYRAYTRACIADFVKDNIQYAEIRPNFMATNSLKSDDGRISIGNEGIMQILLEEYSKTMQEIKLRGDYFGGLKVIYCTPRSFSNAQIEASLNECIDLKLKYKSLICGFDLVGEEAMGNELRHFVPEFLSFQKKCKALNLDIPFLFHCGETLEVGGKIDGNLYDAILLKSKRIGHGYALARHPLLMNIFKEKNIAVETCPISNEILGLAPATSGHHLPIFLANNVPCTINSDNATFYRSSLSHDFYQVMVGAESMTLLGWKQLAKWSLDHSCMEAEQREAVMAEWTRRWDEFCRWIVDEFGDELRDWEPSQGRR